MKNKIHILKSILLFLIATFAIPLQSHATEYYVDTNAPSASDSNPGTAGQPWKTISKANQTLIAGDVVYIKAGTYATYINPSNSGTAIYPITYCNYANDIVTISSAAYAVYLNGKSYIKVNGINSTGCTQNLYIRNGAHYNTISNCTFTLPSLSTWNTSVIYGGNYNWIHHCTFSKGGECTSQGSDNGSLLDIGDDYGVAGNGAHYNLVEDCTFFHGGHHLVGLFSTYNTFRNNYLHNEGLSRNRGNRNLMTDGGNAAGTESTGYNLIEGNRFGYAAPPCDDPTVGNVILSSPYNILRYNKLYHHNAYGIGIYAYQYCTGSNNKVYNNTVFNSGYGIDPGYAHSSEDATVSFFFTKTVNNIFKNNLFFAYYQVFGGSPRTLQIYANNWAGDTQGDPKFVNASTTPPADKTDASLPNLDLQSSSPAIDKGGALTTVTSATGSGTSLTVANASYFQDGTYGPPGVLQADWIAVGTIGNVVQILSISGNTINVANSISWTNGASVWLYKKSDGVRVLYGAAPDAGAYEFSQAQAPSPPKNLTVISP